MCSVFFSRSHSSLFFGVLVPVEYLFFSGKNAVYGQGYTVNKHCFDKKLINYTTLSSFDLKLL